MHLRRLTPSPTELPETFSYSLSLRPRDLHDQIIEALRSNDLPLVSLNQSLDFQIIQRLVSENSRIKYDLIGLSLASYRDRETSTFKNNDEVSFKNAETLINYLLSKINDEELQALKHLLQTEIIDDHVLSNLINFIRLSGIHDPLKFVEIFERSLSGTFSLRNFMGNLNGLTNQSVIKLEDLGSQQVSPEILNSINEKEAAGLAEINERASSIENERIREVENIQQNAQIQRILLNTGITFGVSSLVWAGYRYGVWESVVRLLNTAAPVSIRQNDPSVLENVQLGLAGLTGFLLKKGLLRR